MSFLWCGSRVRRDQLHAVRSIDVGGRPSCGEAFWVFDRGYDPICGRPIRSLRLGVPMIREATVVAFAVSFGCVSVKWPEKEPAARPKGPMVSANREELDMAKVEAIRAKQQEEQDRASLERATARAAAFAASCAEDREERLSRIVAWDKARASEVRYAIWKAEHCQTVDRSVGVVRTKQDRTGRLYQVEGRSRGVDTECDKTKPPERHMNPPVQFAPFGKDKDCKSLDIESSEIAKARWESYDRLGRPGPDAPWTEPGFVATGDSR